MTECNRAREEYNEQLHNFPIILFAKFYGYHDKPMINIPLAYYSERGPVDINHSIHTHIEKPKLEEQMGKKKRGRPKKEQ